MKTSPIVFLSVIAAIATAPASAHDEISSPEDVMMTSDNPSEVLAAILTVVGFSTEDCWDTYQRDLDYCREDMRQCIIDNPDERDWCLDNYEHACWGSAWRLYRICTGWE